MTYYLAFGSNVGDKLLFLNKAIKGLSHVGKILKKSAIYNSEPIGEKKQDNFFNAMIKYETSLTPLQLLDKIKQIEKSIGRTKTYRWGPREIDIDIIEYDGPEIKGENLTIPHLEMEKRKFVLLPFSEVENEFITRSGQSIKQVLLQCSDRSHVEQLKHLW
jgi:2-amino-4-hydroxy-6-hydroxymethyldihydropteridine diphosphokinase